MSNKSPVELRVGSTGAGAFLGCGAGVGLVAPVALHSIPVVGQVASSLSTSLAGLDGALGGAGRALRRRVQAAGIKGLDAGFGCGVMLGYGYGAGLFLKPAALQGLGEALGKLQEQALARLPASIAGPLRQRTQQLGSGGSISSSADAWQAGGAHGASQPQQLHSELSLEPTQPQPTAAPIHAEPQPQQAEPQQQQQQELTELSRLVLRQQNQLAEVQVQLEALQVAVCKLDPNAKGCKKQG